MGTSVEKMEGRGGGDKDEFLLDFAVERRFVGKL